MTYWVITIAIVAIALCIIAVVAVGMQGSLADKVPEVANVLANTARHLNGDADPPQGLVAFFEEIPRSATSAPRSVASAPEAPNR